MNGLERPLLIVSDTHLGPDARPGLLGDLAALVRSHRGAELVLAGDVFDLSYAPKVDASAGVLAKFLARAPEVVRALREHAGRGDPITFIPGNHDAALVDAAISRDLPALLGVQARAPVSVSPWFVRRNGVHVEHGHAYDPDNAPIHPLVEWSDRTEPLGIALTRRFVFPRGASIFSHAHGSTPASALFDAFRVYRHRAPGMLAHYFRISIALCLEAGSRLGSGIERELGLGAVRLTTFAGTSGLSEAELGRLLEAMPRPTHLRRRDVFFRLYFDRVFAFLLGAAGLASLGRRHPALWLALASAAYLGGSILGGRDRYGTLPEQRLALAARRVRELTRARDVVFGHTHSTHEEEGYVNSGSFAFPRGTGRPYVRVEPSGRAELRRYSAAAP